MHNISKNWDRVFYFQYKVVTGQCETGHYGNSSLWQFMITHSKLVSPLGI